MAVYANAYAYQHAAMRLPRVAKRPKTRVLSNRPELTNPHVGLPNATKAQSFNQVRATVVDWEAADMAIVVDITPIAEGEVVVTLGTVTTLVMWAMPLMMGGTRETSLIPCCTPSRMTPMTWLGLLHLGTISDRLQCLKSFVL